MTRSCENAPVHSELFVYSTLKTMGTGDATDAGRNQQHSAPRLPFSNQVRYCSAAILWASQRESPSFGLDSVDVIFALDSTRANVYYFAALAFPSFDFYLFF
jgi:hypothetical protein